MIIDENMQVIYHNIYIIINLITYINQNNRLLSVYNHQLSLIIKLKHSEHVT